MMLGAYEFEWVPDEMDIPRPEKTVAVQQNLGNVGFFSWGPQLIGKNVVMKWKFVSRTQYEAFRTLFLAGGVHVLDLSSSTVYIAPPPVGGLDTFVFRAYPDPAHPGAVPAPPYKRYFIGYQHGGLFVPNNYVYWNWSPVGDSSAPSYNGYAKAIDVSDPAAMYIDFGPDGVNLPDFRVGDTIFDDGGIIWGTVVPWDPDLRAYYLYPAAPSATDKIYYSNVVGAWPSYPATVLHVGNEVYLDYDSMPSWGYCVITELGSDEIGTWFRCDAVPSYRLIQWTAGNIANVEAGTGGGTATMMNIKPWGPVLGGPFG